MAADQPTFDSYIAPLFKLLAEHPEGLTTTEAYSILAERTGLSETLQKEMIPSGHQPAYHNRIGWAHDRLKRAGLSESVKRGTWALTDAGRAVLDLYNGRLPEEVITALARPRTYDLPQRGDEPQCASSRWRRVNQTG